MSLICSLSLSLTLSLPLSLSQSHLSMCQKFYEKYQRWRPEADFPSSSRARCVAPCCQSKDSVYTHPQKNIRMPIKFILRRLLHFYQSQLLANNTSARFPNYMGIAVIMSDSDSMATPAMFPVKNIIVLL